MSNEKIDVEKIKSEYDVLYKTSRKCMAELVRQFSELLEQNQIVLGVPIESRIKEFKSLNNKIEKKNFEIRSIKEVEDLIGVRMILLFKRDLEKVDNLIKENFEVLDFENKLEQMEVSQFGYTSIHYLIKFPDSWLTLPALKQFKGLQAEIQVRTVAQHIWAVASHKLQYKNEESVPKEIRRSINRVSALLETVDLEFERILEEKVGYREELNSAKYNDDSLINADLLERILNDLLPPEHKDEVGAEDYSELVTDLSINEIYRTGELIRMIQKHLSQALEDDKKRVKHLINEDVEILLELTKDPKRLERGVFYNHTGLLRAIISLETGQDWYITRLAEYRKEK